MPDFESKGEDIVNMCKTFVLCQEEDSDVPPRRNYSNISDDESSHAEISSDELYQEEDTDNDDVCPRGNYSDFR